MHILAFFLLITSLLLQTLAQQPCGARIAPCPSEQICIRNDPNCLRGENCIGICLPAPDFNDPPNPPTIPTATHRSCGVRTADGIYNCEDDEICVDDPDRPSGSCGMACDVPGICVRRGPLDQTGSKTWTTLVTMVPKATSWF